MDFGLMDGASPTKRALLALEVLQDSPGVSAERLAGRLGVTDRAVRRYVGLLRDAGIPIESTTGRYGGYRLGRGTRLPPLMLSAAEALGLVMAVLEGRPGAVDSADPVGTALGKITRVLPTSLAESVAAIRQVTTTETGFGTHAPDPETTAILVRASDSGHRIRLSYRLSEIRVMEVDPWAVSVWRGRWYLLCWSSSSTPLPSGSAAGCPAAWAASNPPTTAAPACSPAPTCRSGTPASSPSSRRRTASSPRPSSRKPPATSLACSRAPVRRPRARSAPCSVFGSVQES